MNFCAVNHQSFTSTLGFSGLGVFSHLRSHMTQTASSTALIALTGYLSTLISSMCYFLIVFRAYSAFFKIGKAISRSFSQSILISCAYIATALHSSSSFLILSFWGSTSLSAFSLIKIFCLSVFSCCYWSFGCLSLISACMIVISSYCCMSF